jgi:DNA repair ATPase RecN
MIDRTLLEARYADDPVALALIEYTCALERQYATATADFAEADEAVNEWRKRSMRQDQELEQLRDHLQRARKDVRAAQGGYSSSREYAAEKELANLQETMKRLQDFDFKVNKKAKAPFGKTP